MSLEMNLPIRIKNGLKMGIFHFFISALIIGILFSLIKKWWYPYPFGKLMGGFDLFFLVLLADLICGPILTIIVFDFKKKTKEKIFDFFVIGLIQLAALFYGLHAIYVARPIALVYEVDRFVAISVADVDGEYLDETNVPDMRLRKWWSLPTLLSVRAPKNADEYLSSIDLSIQGREPSVRPSWWLPYEDGRQQLINRMKSAKYLINNLKTSDVFILEKSIGKTKFSIEDVYYLPLTSNFTKDDWIVLLDERGDVVGYSEVSGF